MSKANEPTKNNESFREHLSTIDEDGKRKWIFPKKPKGSYYQKRTIVSWIYYIVFFSLPLISFQGKPLFLFNFIKGEYILFGKIFWPQDFLIFGLMMLAGLLFIALFTMVFGRFFCGWICPQTVFMELLFRRIDYLVLGDGQAQKYLHKQPWSNIKIRKYTIRYVLYLLISFIIANTFLAYIIGVEDLWKIATEPISEHLGGFISIWIFTIVFFCVFAFLREQVCTNICPYGRLQGVLLDKNSIAVIYDYVRGEPRGKFTHNKQSELGDCIDCDQCVQVCPTGIDIRNGIQLECTNCTACIDACNFMMEKVGKPKGLIRYDSEANVAEKKKFTYTTRIKVYSLILVGILTAITTLLITRKDIGVKLMRSGGLTYQTRGTDSISNLYTVKLENKTNDTLHVSFTIQDNKGAVEMVGNEQLLLLPADRASSSFFIVLPKDQLTDRKNEINVEVWSEQRLMQTITTTFLAPIKNKH